MSKADFNYLLHDFTERCRVGTLINGFIIFEMYAGHKKVYFCVQGVGRRWVVKYDENFVYVTE